MEQHLKLYQIGGVRIDLDSQETATPYKHESQSKKSERLMHSSRIAPANDVYLPKSQTIQVEGFLLGDKRRMAMQKLQQLRSHVGLPTWMIGYVLIDGLGQPLCCDCLLEKDCQVVWLQAYGTITRLTPDQKKDTEPPTLKMDIELLSYWQGLNPVVWQWKKGDSTSLYQTPVPENWAMDLSNSYPSCDELFTDRCVDCGSWQFIQYENHHSSTYDENYFTLRHSAFCADGISTGEGSLFTSNINRWRTTYADGMFWGAPPSSVYAFKDLPITGDIIIYVQKSIGIHRNDSTTTLSLDDLNTLLSDSGYVGIQATDILYIGDVRRRDNGILYSPAFIERDSAILPVFPVVTYPDEFPAQLGVGTSRYFIQAPMGAEVAYMHTYMRL